ncbi:MAG: SOS response-associated peptidase [Polymorphobacter sp.]
MCNSYRLRGREIEIAQAMGIPFEADINLPPTDLFPKRPALVVRQAGGIRQGALLEWGFPPPAGVRGPVTNVRNLASPFWRSALANPERRCLIPATEFCEWEGEKGAKVARWFRVPSTPVFALAGIWRPLAADLLGQGGGCFAMLTCEPNALVGAVHPNAMPVILHPEEYENWLTAPLADVLPLAAPFPTQLMAMT